jgi:hypothetical protein
VLEKAHRHHSAAGATPSYTNHQARRRVTSATRFQGPAPRNFTRDAHRRSARAVPEPPRKTTNAHTITPANLCAHYIHDSTNTLRCIGPAHKHTRPKPLQSRTTITLSSPTPIPTTPPRPQNQRPSTHNRSLTHSHTHEHCLPLALSTQPNKILATLQSPTRIATPRDQTPSEVPIGGPRMMLRVDLALCRRVAILGGRWEDATNPAPNPAWRRSLCPRPAQRG